MVHFSPTTKATICCQKKVLSSICSRTNPSHCNCHSISFRSSNLGSGGVDFTMQLHSCRDRPCRPSTGDRDPPQIRTCGFPASGSLSALPPSLPSSTCLPPFPPTALVALALDSAQEYHPDQVLVKRLRELAGSHRETATLAELEASLVPLTPPDDAPPQQQTRPGCPGLR